MKSLSERIDDLIVQATTERSHYYTASTLLEIRDELRRLNRKLAECDTWYHTTRKYAE